MYATDGDDTLGGSDIDLCMYNILKEKIHKISGVDISSSSNANSEANSQTNSQTTNSNSNSVNSELMCTAAAVHTMAEEIKKALTYSAEVEFRCILPNVSNKCNFFSLLFLSSCCIFIFVVYGYKVCYVPKCLCYNL